MFTVLKTEDRARRGEFTCPHGTAQTPVFMVSFDDVLSDEKLSAAASYGEAYRRSPEEQVLARESAEEIIQTYSRCLSKFETEILKLYLNGSSYSEIAEACGKTEKSVDNAVQRIRRKLARSLSPSDNSDSCSQNRCPQG